MPRKAKDKEELIEEKNNKSKKTTRKSTKSTSLKSSARGSAKKAVTTQELKTKEGDLKKSTSTKNSKSKKESTAKKSTISKKRNEFFTEYYDLPFSYNKTVVKLLAQTPETLFVYWEISDDDKKMYKEKYGENFFETSTPILKVHNKTMNYSFEVEINDFANCWYLHINDSKCEYEIELDRKKYITNEEPEYVYISNSNKLEAPNDKILINELQNYVTFKNIKTNAYKKVSVPKNITKIFDKEEIFNIFYNDKEFINNPSSKF